MLFRLKLRMEETTFFWNSYYIEFWGIMMNRHNSILLCLKTAVTK